ncbi:hypothetical protein V2G26_001126 [Clonostachys chloroleuca]
MSLASGSFQPVSSPRGSLQPSTWEVPPCYSLWRPAVSVPRQPPYTAPTVSLRAPTPRRYREVPAPPIENLNLEGTLGASSDCPSFFFCLLCQFLVTASAKPSTRLAAIKHS